MIIPIFTQFFKNLKIVKNILLNGKTPSADETCNMIENTFGVDLFASRFFKSKKRKWSLSYTVVFF